MLQHASRTAEAAEVSISIEAVLATPHAFDAEKCSISCTSIYFIPVSYSLTAAVWSSGPVEAAHVAGGGALLHPSNTINAQQNSSVVDAEHCSICAQACVCGGFVFWSIKFTFQINVYGGLHCRRSCIYTTVRGVEPSSPQYSPSFLSA